MQLSEKLGKYPEGRNEGSEKSHQPAFLKHGGRWVSKSLQGTLGSRRIQFPE